jgi:hypothetical protein
MVSALISTNYLYEREWSQGDRGWEKGERGGREERKGGRKEKMEIKGENEKTNKNDLK